EVAVKRNDPYIEILRRRRFRKKLKRSRRQRRAGAISRSPPPLRRGQRDPLLNFLRQHFKAKSIAEPDGSDNNFLVRIPEVFSFTDNPGPTLNVIYSVLDVSTRPDARSLRFDHSKCIQMDLGASTVL